MKSLWEKHQTHLHRSHRSNSRWTPSPRWCSRCNHSHHKWSYRISKPRRIVATQHSGHLTRSRLYARTAARQGIQRLKQLSELSHGFSRSSASYWAFGAAAAAFPSTYVGWIIRSTHVDSVRGRLEFVSLAESKIGHRKVQETDEFEWDLRLPNWL